MLASLTVRHGSGLGGRLLHPEFNHAQQLVNKKQSVLQPRDVVSEVATGKQFAGWLKTAAARHLHQVVYVCFTLFV